MMRVYELARELNIENKEVLSLFEQLGISGKSSHSSAISDTEADKVRKHILRSNVVQSDLERDVQIEGQVVREKRVSGNVIRRRKKDDDTPALPTKVEAVKPETILDSSNLESEKDSAKINLELSQVEKSPKKSESSIEDKFKAEIETLEATNENKNIELDTLAETDNQQKLLKQQESKKEDLKSEEKIEEALITSSELVQENEVEDVTTDPSELTIGRDYSANDLVELRKRLDVRAPKVLGKINLPSKAPIAPVKTASSKKSSTGGTGAAVLGTDAEEDAKNARKKGKRGVSVEFEKDPKSKLKKKQILSKGDLLDYEGDGFGYRGKKDRRGKKGAIDPLSAEAIASRAGKRPIKVDGEVTVGEMARLMGLKANQVITELFKLGTMVSINQLIDFDTATIIAQTFGFETQNTETSGEEVLLELTKADVPDTLILRPPVVTVMGHVDHGKTSLLDCIRKTSVTTSEAGGITQHIGAYNVKLASGGSVTFLDTPGHEAFTAMRSRGAKVTDIVVLVVAADDGVMPQTIEAINHAKAAQVPIIVAINKIDKAGANPDKVINQLAEHGLVPEEWGGDTLMVRVSAHTKEGVDTLLETLHLQAEVLELKANPERDASGTVIESKIDKGKGTVLTVLIQNGTLRKGDTFVAGAISGKVRAILSVEGKILEEVGPSMPVEIVGASSTADAGDDFAVTADETQAKFIAEERAARRRKKELIQQSKSTGFGIPLTMERFSDIVINSADKKDLPLIVKVDVQGSLEAVCGSLGQLGNEEVQVKIIHKGIGAISENDAQLAIASNAIMIGFNVRPDTRASQVIEDEGIPVLYSRVIYELVDAVKEALKGKMSPKFQEKVLGRVEVRDIFKVPKIGLVAGSYVLDGTIARGSQVRLIRDGIIVHEGKMGSLRRFKDDVKEVQAGYECGIGIDGYNDIKNGDIIEVFKVEQIQL